MRKGGKIVLILFIVLLLGIIGFGYYYVNRPEVIFTTALNNIYDSIKGDVEEYKQMKVNSDMSLNVDAGTEYKEYTDIINNLKFKSSMNYDLKSESFILGIGADYKNKSLINADIYYENETAYVDLKDLFNKLIKVDLEIEKEDFDIEEDEIEVLIDEITNALKETLKSGEYNTTKDNKITKNTLVINNQNVDKLVSTFIDYLLNSNEFVESFSKIIQEDKEYIIDILKETKEEDYNLESEIKISIYTEGLANKFKKLEIDNDKDTILSYVKEDSINSKIEINVDDVKLIVNIKNDTKSNKVTIKYNIEVLEFKIDLTMDMSYEYNKEIEKPNIKNSVSIEELNEEDGSKILEKLMENEGIVELMEVISSLIPQEEPIEGYEEPILQY